VDSVVDPPGVAIGYNSLDHSARFESVLFFSSLFPTLVVVRLHLVSAASLSLQWVGRSVLHVCRELFC
jgi:hypothetical protein